MIEPRPKDFRPIGAALPWGPEDFARHLRLVGREAYCDRHPFHRRLVEGRLTREQIQAWVANRYYYQRALPIVDAIVMSRCPVRDVRRIWVQRILDHDGTAIEPGRIERWLVLGEAVGLTRDEIVSDRLLVPATRFAVDAYVQFVRERPWVEGVSTSLTDQFAPPLMADRLAALERHYPWIDGDALGFFRMRLSQAPRDARDALRIVIDHARRRPEQELAVEALRFKCQMLWAQLDALLSVEVEEPADAIANLSSEAPARQAVARG
jgi:pyrroloquinoline-quinone synthase